MGACNTVRSQTCATQFHTCVKPCPIRFVHEGWHRSKSFAVILSNEFRCWPIAGSHAASLGAIRFQQSNVFTFCALVLPSGPYLELGLGIVRQNATFAGIQGRKG